MLRNTVLILTASLLMGCGHVSAPPVSTIDPCLLKPDPGYCKAAFPRYYFESSTQSCASFTWGGCGGQMPFETMESCRTACEKASNPGLLERLDAGLEQWQSSKVAQGGAYSYTIEFQSWVGFGHRTRVDVKKNQVVERYFTSWNREGVRTKAWSETSPSDVGSHDQGAVAKTMEQLYEDCRNRVLSKSDKDYAISLVIGEFGQIQSCTFRHLQCADDCSQGIALSSFEFSRSM